jgi:hypothetical protein
MTPRWLPASPIFLSLSAHPCCSNEASENATNTSGEKSFRE